MAAISIQEHPGEEEDSKSRDGTKRYWEGREEFQGKQAKQALDLYNACALLQPDMFGSRELQR